MYLYCYEADIHLSCFVETGCGKTTLIQRLSALSGHDLLVQNLSLQTDSTDLLGGYRPLEIQHVARKVYTRFVDLFVSCYSRSKNAKLLKCLAEMYEQGHWKKFSNTLTQISQGWFKKVGNIHFDTLKFLHSSCHIYEIYTSNLKYRKRGMEHWIICGLNFKP